MTCAQQSHLLRVCSAIRESAEANPEQGADCFLGGVICTALQLENRCVCWLFFQKISGCTLGCSRRRTACERVSRGRTAGRSASNP
jgi:hypothetical protein